MSSDYQQHDDPYRANGSASRYGSYPEDVYEEDEGPNYKRREGSGAVVANKDEGYSSLSFSSIRYVWWTGSETRQRSLAPNADEPSH